MFCVVLVVFMFIGLSSQQNLLLNLDCAISSDCIQFQIPGAPNVTCLESQCSCQNINHDVIPCRPRESKVSNIIGGKCPCSIDNSECNEEEDVCYCLENYTALPGKRSCVRGNCFFYHVILKNLTFLLHHRIPSFGRTMS